MKYPIILLSCCFIYTLNAGSGPQAILMSEVSTIINAQNLERPHLGNPCFVTAEILCHTFGYLGRGARNDMLGHIARNHVTINGTPLAALNIDASDHEKLTKDYLEHHNLKLTHPCEHAKFPLCKMICGCLTMVTCLACLNAARPAELDMHFPPAAAIGYLTSTCSESAIKLPYFRLEEQEKNE